MPPSERACQTPIAIIGAGPGGLSLARILTERGLCNITVVERAPRVGGKSLTVHHRGIGHEMGTCYQTWGYTTVRNWMEEAGITSHRLPVHRLHLGGQEGTIDFKDYVVGDRKARTYAQIAEYNLRWLGFFRGFLLDEDREAWSADVARPFGRWLDDHGLDAIKRFAWRSMTAMGYGHLDQVPALYGLRWNTPSLIASAAALRVDEPVPGWEHLWQHIAARLDVRLSTTVAAVDRVDTGIRIHTTEDEQIDADWLVVSTPLDEAPGWLQLSDEESAAFGPIRWSEYVTTLVEAEGWFTDADTHSFLANLQGADGPRRGHLLVARRTGDKTPVAQIRRRSRPSLYVCYQYGSTDLSDAELQRILFEDIAERGGRVVRVHAQRRWKYAPQLDSQAIAASGAFHLEDLQGRNRTFYTGASLSHEAVDSIVDYNGWLADRIEHAIRREAGERLDGDWLERRRDRQLRSVHNK